MHFSLFYDSISQLNTTIGPKLWGPLLYFIHIMKEFFQLEHEYFTNFRGGGLSPESSTLFTIFQPMKICIIFVDYEEI